MVFHRGMHTIPFVSGRTNCASSSQSPCATTTTKEEEEEENDDDSPKNPKPPSHMASSPSHHTVQQQQEEEEAEEVFWDAASLQEQEPEDTIHQPTNVPWSRWCRMEWTTHGIGFESLLGYFIVSNAVYSLVHPLWMAMTTTQPSATATAASGLSQPQHLPQVVGCGKLATLLMRGMTTSVYWFPSPRVYDCVKFYQHNQQRQQEPGGWYSLVYRWYPRRVPLVEMVVFLWADALLERTFEAW